MIRLYYTDGKIRDIMTNQERLDGEILVIGTYRVPLSKLDGWEVLAEIEGTTQTQGADHDQAG